MSKDLRQAISQIHNGANRLCLNTFGHVLNNAGNIGVFCQSRDEFERFTEIRKSIIKASNNPNQKYFELIKPIIFNAEGNVPKTTYTHLYIRRFDPEEPHLGDVDFYIPLKEFKNLKQRLILGDKIQGARIYDRQDLDMIELFDPAINVLAYVSTKEMTEKARVKQSEETKL